ncbi:MAG: hypothetical protein NTZ41_00085 [Sphingobacteriales bacterium]|jgi:hypothetical protein|nr:hypothetical protein [Sphingobacteriales bacterium]
MVPLEDIEEKYRKMPDHLLLNFAREEIHLLTPDAFRLLLTEIRKRNLEWPEIIASQPEVQLQDEFQEMRIECLVQLKYFTGLGKNHWDIKVLLSEQEYPDHVIDYAFGKFEMETRERLPKADKHLLTGSVFFTSGLAILFLPLVPGKHLLVYILAYLLIIAGVGRFLHGLFLKRSIRKLLQQLKPK